jgi:hypothetical protein
MPAACRLPPAVGLSAATNAEFPLEERALSLIGAPGKKSLHLICASAEDRAFWFEGLQGLVGAPPTRAARLAHPHTPAQSHPRRPPFVPAHARTVA